MAATHRAQFFSRSRAEDGNSYARFAVVMEMSIRGAGSHRVACATDGLLGAIGISVLRRFRRSDGQLFRGGLVWRRRTQELLAGDQSRCHSPDVFTRGVKI